MPLFGKFPIYEKHTEVRCFKCDKPLGGLVSSGAGAPGNGEFSQECPDCRMFTFYDIKEIKS